ncbi:MAG: type IV toxin-antitoxin system AbiEi family antitoxin domain-containing protein [Acidimicrobiales bacterium]
MPSNQTLSRIADVAAEQWGLLTRRQIEDSGVSAATLQRLAIDGTLQRLAHGVYQLAGAPTPDHLALRAAWLQLAPSVPVWERTPDNGVVSHRSAAALYSLSHLPADRHDFIVPERRQTRRRDVRLHVVHLDPGEWVNHGGLFVTRPSRIASDLLADHEDPEAVAQLVADSIRAVYDYPGTFADRLAPYAARLGLRRGDGLGLLRWFVSLVGDPDSSRWIEEAEAHEARKSSPGEAVERFARIPR